ncbi:MAG: type II secretion system F family protein [Candidatus Aenigmarchaeota archaeon]|nr:type II secretion system F family protein [Candidatus Aenigmarchaeota archaeon]MDW8159823.1 type II secretion system F family protein [Candidatus Aenigmarchaeota archaeon]
MGLISGITKIFGPLVEKNEEFFKNLKDAYQKSGIKLPFISYASLMIFLSLIGFFYASILTFFILYIFTKSMFISVSYSILVGFLAAFFSFIIMYFYPSQRIISRRKKIEGNLPFVLIHMSALVDSGLPPYQMFKLISEFEEYGEISKEFKKIVRNIEEFGLDPLTAIKEAAMRSPSEDLQQLLFGFITTIESGGNIKLYLKTVGEQTLFDYRKKREKYIRTLDLMSELYTGIIVTSPLFLVAMLAIMSMIQPTLGGWSIKDLVWLGAYVIVPSINVFFILFLNTMEVEM